jgi:hypothetical protein
MCSVNHKAKLKACGKLHIQRNYPKYLQNIYKQSSYIARL